MCGKYQVTTRRRELMDRFHAEFPDADQWLPSVKAYPEDYPGAPEPKGVRNKFYDWGKQKNLINCGEGQLVPVLRQVGKKRQIELMRWGFDLLMARDDDDEESDDPLQARRVVNTKSETMNKLRTWKRPFEEGQFCGMIVSRYYEPPNPENAKAYPKGAWLSKKGSGLFLIAGIWDERKLLLGKEKGTTARCVSMITSAPNELTEREKIHHRMPSVLGVDEEEKFFENVDNPAWVQKRLSTPYPGSDLLAADS